MPPEEKPSKFMLSLDDFRTITRRFLLVFQKTQRRRKKKTRLRTNTSRGTSRGKAERIQVEDLLPLLLEPVLHAALLVVVDHLGEGEEVAVGPVPGNAREGRGQ